jgi:hypothetical protein
MSKREALNNGKATPRGPLNRMSMPRCDPRWTRAIRPPRVRQEPVKTSVPIAAVRAKEAVKTA